MAERYPDKIEVEGSIPSARIMENEYSEYNEYIAYLCDKVQHITQAVYRVTDILPDREPLKWEMREKAVSLFTALTSFQNKDYLEKLRAIEKSEKTIEQIIVILSLLPAGMLISGLNFEILKNEYLAVKKAISQEKIVPDLNAFVLGGEAPFKLPAISIPETPASREQESIGHNNGQTNGQERQKNNSHKKSVIPKTSTEDRKQRILEILKTKQKVSVGELSVLFSEFSEKTIQRDLVEMADKGILRKEGDKRWRIYILTK